MDNKMYNNNMEQFNNGYPSAPRIQNNIENQAGAGFPNNMGFEAGMGLEGRMGFEGGNNFPGGIGLSGGMRPEGGMGFPGGAEFGDGQSMEDRFKARRAEQLYQRLAEQGQFAEIDKAKHNDHYRDYLLENFEDEQYY